MVAANVILLPLVATHIIQISNFQLFVAVNTLSAANLLHNEAINVLSHNEVINAISHKELPDNPFGHIDYFLISSIGSPRGHLLEVPR